ncbi:hypothetical protein GCM10009867_01400 [Pedococcus aerophilus]|uniref:Uncharacterized protein n=1 Tax=Pedococcus aerophilus TaxID=436356 RepID=A0ABN3UD25_9MICO
MEFALRDTGSHGPTRGARPAQIGFSFPYTAGGCRRLVAPNSKTCDNDTVTPEAEVPNPATSGVIVCPYPNRGPWAL